MITDNDMVVPLMGIGQVAVSLKGLGTYVAAAIDAGLDVNPDSVEFLLKLLGDKLLIEHKALSELSAN